MIRWYIEQIQQAGTSAIWKQISTNIAFIPTCLILEDLYLELLEKLKSCRIAFFLFLSLSLSSSFLSHPPSIPLFQVPRRDTMHPDRPGQVQYWNIVFSLNIDTNLDLSPMQNVTGLFRRRWNRPNRQRYILFDSTVVIPLQFAMQDRASRSQGRTCLRAP